MKKDIEKFIMERFNYVSIVNIRIGLNKNFLDIILLSPPNNVINITPYVAEIMRETIQNYFPYPEYALITIDIKFINQNLL